jgi:hypothetical protein
VQVFLEIYTAIGASAANCQVTYTDQTGATGQTATIALQASPLAGQLQPVFPSLGCRSVQSVQLDATTGTVGDFGITLARPILKIPIDTGGTSVVQGPFTAGLEEIISNACLAAMILTSTTNTGIVTSEFTLLQN